MRIGMKENFNQIESSSDTPSLGKIRRVQLTCGVYQRNAYKLQIVEILHI